MVIVAVWLASIFERIMRKCYYIVTINNLLDDISRSISSKADE